MTRALLAALAAMLGAAALSGCGGSGPAAETSPLQSGAPVAAAPVVRVARRAHTVRRRERRPVRHRSPAAVSKPGFSPVAAGNTQALNTLAASVSRPASHAAALVPASSPSSFVASADAICSGYRRAVRATGTSAVTLVAEENELSTLVGETARALKRLQVLASPSRDDSLVSRFIALTQASVGDFVKAQARSSSTSETVGTASEAKDMALAETSAKDALAAQAAAHRLGLHVCGSSGAEWL